MGTNKNTMSATPLVELTSELLARASSTSEVLTLNLTNLLILIVLKAIIFGFGLFSVGSSARSSEDTSLSQADLSGGMCFIMYTSGAEEKLSCIKTNYNERGEEIKRHWGGGSLGNKSAA